MKSLINNRVLQRLAALSIFFLLIVFVWPGSVAVEIFNGVFLGVLVAVILMYWRVTWQTVAGRGPYRRAQQMVLGIAFAWLAISTGRGLSIASRINSDQLSVLNTSLSALVPFLAIVAGYLQFTAPGFDDKYMHRGSRKRLLLAGSAGLIIGGLAIWLQAS